MCIVFGLLVFGMLLINPISFIGDYPPEIQEQYYLTQHKEKVREKLTAIMKINKVIAVIIFLLVFAWMAHIAGANTFLEGMLMVYGYMFILFAFDTFFLDWVLFANMKRIRLPGTENMDKEYHQKWFHVKVCIPMITVFAIGGLAVAGLMILIW